MVLWYPNLDSREAEFWGLFLLGGKSVWKPHEWRNLWALSERNPAQSSLLKTGDLLASLLGGARVRHLQPELQTSVGHPLSSLSCCPGALPASLTSHGSASSGKGARRPAAPGSHPNSSATRAQGIPFPSERLKISVKNSYWPSSSPGLWNNQSVVLRLAAQLGSRATHPCDQWEWLEKTDGRQRWQHRHGFWRNLWSQWSP